MGLSKVQFKVLSHSYSSCHGSVFEANPSDTPTVEKLRIYHAPPRRFDAAEWGEGGRGSEGGRGAGSEAGGIEKAERAHASFCHV